MTKAVQRRRGTSAEHSSFTGLLGELSVNTTNDSVHVHDGATAGGFELARADGSNVSEFNVVQLTGTIQALGSISGSNNIDISAGDTVTATITGATAFTVSNLVSGKSNTLTMYLTNPGAGAITWPSGTVFNLSGSPTLPSTGNTIIILETYDNGTSWAGIQAWRDSN